MHYLVEPTHPLSFQLVYVNYEIHSEPKPIVYADKSFVRDGQKWIYSVGVFNPQEEFPPVGVNLTLKWQSAIQASVIHYTIYSQEQLVLHVNQNN